MEDHLEVIYELINQKSYAMPADISESLNVSSPSVTKMVRRLYEQGYLNTIDRIFDNDRDEQDIANMDGEGIEHQVHSETLKKLEEFVRNQELVTN